MAALGRRSRGIWIIDLRPGSPEPLPHLSEAVTIVDRPYEAAVRPRLAIGVCGLGSEDWAGGLAAWAWSAGVALFTVAVDARVAVIGPLTVPGRVGCGHCAAARIRAAAAANGLGLGDAPCGDAEWVADLLASELDAIDLDEARLRDHVVTVSADGGLAGRHRFLALPTCPVCGGAAAAGLDTAPTERLSDWVDPLTGLIPGLQIERPGDRGLPIVVTTLAPRLPSGGSSPAGWGKGLTLGAAVYSAIGEALERYCASVPDPERLVWARAEDLDGDHLSPGGLYSDEQYAREGFPFVRFDPALVHPWARGRWLGGGEVWVPAVLCHLALTIAPENHICQGTSNGLATAASAEEAALRATLELIERDALMTAWLTGAGTARVRVDDPRLARIIEAIEELGGRTETYLLESVWGVTALCAAFGDGRSWPGVTIALAADADADGAVRGAVLELGQTGPYLRRLLTSGAVAVPERPDAVHELLDHATFYFPAERAEAFDRLRSREKPQPLSPARSERSLAAGASALGAAGIRVAVVDVTSRDVRTGPFRVVRAVSPDLQPISYGYGLERAPVARIRDRVRSQGLPPIQPVW